MNALSISLVVCACTFGSAVLGLFIQRLLPEHHVTPNTKEVVRLGMGIVATMMALVLGLLVASAKNFYDSQSAETTQLASNAVVLDRILSHYGPEAEGARALLRQALAEQIDALWPPPQSHQAQTRPTKNELILDQIQALTPITDRQKLIQNQAVSVTIQTGQLSWLMFEQQQVPFPRVFLYMLVFWLVTLFMSFGLFAPPNFTVHASLFVAAIAVCGSVLLILEMYQPYSGLIHISDAPLRAALAQLGK